MIEFGIKKYVPSGSATSNAIKMADNYIKTNTDETGKVVDPSVYDSAIESFLSPYSDDLKVQSKILTIKNQQKVLISKLEDREKNVNLFRVEAQKRIDQILRQKYSDSFDVVAKLAEINMALLSTFKEQIYDEAVADKTLTQTIQNEYDSINNQTTLLTEIVNARTFGSPYNPDAYGWFIKTNPNDGSIVNMEFREATDIKEADFRKTDVNYGTIPIYLYSYGPTGKKQGNLGGLTFTEDEQDKILRSKGALERLDEFSARMWAAILPGTTSKEKGKTQREFPMSNVSFNSYAVPKETVVKDGLGNYYWFDNQGKLNKAYNTEELKTFLSSIGKNPQDVDNHFYMALPDFVDEFWKPDEAGKKSVLETKKLTVAPIGERPRSITGLVGAGYVPTPSWMTTRIPAVQPEAPKYTPEGYETSKIIEEGKKIFKPITKPFEDIFRKY